MKIAMIGQKGIPANIGGVERHVEELSTRLVNHGHEVIVFCRNWYVPKKIPQYQGVQLVFTHSWYTKHLDAISHTFFSILKATQLQVDVFHFHGVGPALLCWLAKILCPSAKVIVTFHTPDQFHEKWNKLAKYMLRLGEWFACKIPDITIVVSKNLQHYCRQIYKKETVYIPNGAKTCHQKSPSTILVPFKLNAHEYILMCSRLVPHKGAHLLIEAWKKAKQLHPEHFQNKQLAIVGGSAFTDDYVKQLYLMAKEDPSIILTGPQTGEILEALFTHSYAMIHPSSSEGMPIAILEGMSYGKCVLGADIPENKEILKSHGLAFEKENVVDLAQKIIFLLEHPDILDEKGQQARMYVAKHYDWDDIAQTTHHLYEWIAVKHEPLLRKIE